MTYLKNYVILSLAKVLFRGKLQRSSTEVLTPEQLFPCYFSCLKGNKREFKQGRQQQQRRRQKTIGSLSKEDIDDNENVTDLEMQPHVSAIISQSFKFMALENCLLTILELNWNQRL